MCLTKGEGTLAVVTAVLSGDQIPYVGVRRNTACRGAPGESRRGKAEAWRRDA